MKKHFVVNLKKSEEKLKENIVFSKDMRNPLYAALEFVTKRAAGEGTRCPVIQSNVRSFRDLLCPEIPRSKDYCGKWACVEENVTLNLALKIPDSGINYFGDAEFCNTLFATAIIEDPMPGSVTLGVYIEDGMRYAEVLGGQQQVITMLGVLGIFEEEHNKKVYFDCNNVMDGCFTEEQMEKLKKYNGYTFDMLPSDIQNHFFYMPIHLDIYSAVSREEMQCVRNRYRKMTKR